MSTNPTLHATRCGQLWEDHGAFIRMTLDATVLLLGVAALIAGAATFQKVERVVVYVQGYNPQQWVQPVAIEEFYTLSTCYLTYYKKVCAVYQLDSLHSARYRHRSDFLVRTPLQTPVCLDKGLNPAPKITASLVMLFITCLCMILCAVVRPVLYPQNCL